MSSELRSAPRAAVREASAEALTIVLRCAPHALRRARYVFDTLSLAADIPLRWADAPPSTGPWVAYGTNPPSVGERDRALFIAHDPRAWQALDGESAPSSASLQDGVPLVFPGSPGTLDLPDAIAFDLIANAFYFLSSWAERRGRPAGAPSRQLYSSCEFRRLDLPQDVVDRYLEHFTAHVHRLYARLDLQPPPTARWPGGKEFALVLSHDVDYLPVRRFDNTREGAKAVLRHLIRQRDPGDACRAARGWLACILQGRDPYGCVPEIIAHERELGVRSSFQVAVGHRHPADVNYRIEADPIRDYLRAITDAGFDLCLHGSYRSTENLSWYVEEARLLEQRLARPLGSRQHFLSFDYDQLFAAQEAAGIRYDMSMGFPDHPGPRAGFSFPYFPYNLREDRPYRVLEISLFLMDVTLRSYLGLRPEPAREVIDAQLGRLRAKGGCASAVWHPIVFGGARDPGYDRLYYDMAGRIGSMGGLATDGRTVNDFWRSRARGYASFDFA